MIKPIRTIAATMPSRPGRLGSAMLTSLALGWAASSPSLAESPAPLFSSNDELTLTLEAPIRTLINRRTRRPVVNGSVNFTDAGSVEQTLDVKVTTRGFSRLEVCTFPPLSLNFKRRQVENTVFAEQNKLKLVTLCQTRGSYAQYLELEYLAYRIFNELTEFSFRVRPVQMRYVDSDRPDRVTEAPAFFIEHINGVAARTGMRDVDLPSVDRNRLDHPRTATYSLFQFLVGNTDFSATSPAEGEDCCHNNAVLVSNEDPPAYIVIPYDFDQTGLVNASYSEPHPDLRIRSVRQRLYRGFCADNEYLDESIALLNEARPRIEALFSSNKLEENSRERALEFLAAGYAVLNDAEELEDEVISQCRGS